MIEQPSTDWDYEVARDDIKGGWYARITERENTEGEWEEVVERDGASALNALENALVAYINLLRARCEGL